MSEVVGLGALNMDRFYRVERVLSDDETVVQERASAPGGSAANTIHALAKLGVSCGFLGAVGDDEAGRALLGDFAQVGVDTSRVKVKPGVASGEVLCLTDGRARSLYVAPGANSLLVPEDVDLEYLKKAKVAHLSSFVDERQWELVNWLVTELPPQVALSFSPGALYVRKGLEGLRPILARTRLLFLNQKELYLLTGMDFPEGAEVLLGYGPGAVAVTFGAGRALPGEGGLFSAGIVSEGDEYLIEAKARAGALPVDTTGAGDAFAAGVLYGRLRGESWRTCGELGYALAQCAVARLGARTGLPTRQELAAAYRELYGRVAGCLS